MWKPPPETGGRGGEKAVEWIRQLNCHALRPDLTIVLDLPSDLAATRREVRGEAAQLYEQNEVQRALAEFYRDLARHMPEDRVVVIDGKGTIDDVHSRDLRSVSLALSLKLGARACS